MGIETINLEWYFSIRLEDFSNQFNFQSVQSMIYFKFWRLLAGFIDWILVLSNSNHLSLLASRQEEGGGTFLGADDPQLLLQLILRIRRLCCLLWVIFSHPYRTIFNLRIWLYSINSLINSLSVNHWQVIGRTIWRRLTSLYNLSSIIWQEFWWSKHLSNLLNKTMWILFTLLMLGSK